MSRFPSLVIKHRGVVLTMFLALAAVSMLLVAFISVNYNMVDYLPQDAQSTIAISIMEEEFSGDAPNTRVMVTNVTLQEALVYKDKLSAIAGVAGVNWLDDVLGRDVLLSTPLEFLDLSLTENYYKEGHALFNLAIENGRESPAMQEIYSLIGRDNAAAGRQ
ncbi:MAG: hypothetical protein RQM92_12495 [Candidatus Syntrophopropionicum ammoniitolerans]